MNSSFSISNKKVGLDNPCLIVAEVAQAHEGSLGIAHSYIDAIAAAGADAVKFQTHIASAESTKDEPWRIQFSKQDNNRYEYWQRMEFTQSQWSDLKQHANEKDLIFLSSPFSSEAVELLDSIDIPAWKVPSGEVNNFKLLDDIAQTRKPVLLSSGISYISELDAAVGYLKKKNIFDIALFQCTASYPCPPEKVGINLIKEFQKKYTCPIGLSDHSATIYAGLAAATLGVSLLEVHVTFHNKLFGPDVSSSLTLDELHQLVEGVRFIETMRLNPLDKDSIANEMMPLRKLFTKSIVTKEFLSAGTVLTKEHVLFKKPGTGIPSSQINDVIGLCLKVDVEGDHLLSFDDFM